VPFARRSFIGELVSAIVTTGGLLAFHRLRIAASHDGVVLICNVRGLGLVTCDPSSQREPGVIKGDVTLKSDAAAAKLCTELRAAG
jgi:hypothetical protein